MSRGKEDPLRLLYIAGMGRSGSTLLARLLGEIEGFFNIGEGALYLFNDVIRARATACGCGRDLGDCPFWGDLPGRVDPSLRRFATRFVRLRNLPWLISSGGGRGLRRKREGLLASLGEVLAEVKRRSGCRVIVDASKNPANAFLLARLPEVELHVLHLVRDSRAVVSSWQRPKGYLRRQGSLEVALRWSAHNSVSEFLQGSVRSYQRVLFEQALEDLPATLDRLLVPLGGAGAALSFLHPGEAQLSPQHSLAGNPDKFHSGRVPIRPRPWSLPRGRRWLVSLITFPWLWHYGYLSRRGRPGGSSGREDESRR